MEEELGEWWVAAVKKEEEGVCNERVSYNLLKSLLRKNFGCLFIYLCK